MLILREQHAAGVLKMVKNQPAAIKKQKRKPGKSVLTGKKFRESFQKGEEYRKEKSCLITFVLLFLLCQK